MVTCTCLFVCWLVGRLVILPLFDPCFLRFRLVWLVLLLVSRLLHCVQMLGACVIEYFDCLCAVLVARVGCSQPLPLTFTSKGLGHLAASIVHRPLAIGMAPLDTSGGFRMV